MTGLPQDIADQNEFAIYRHEFFLLPRLWKSFTVTHSLHWNLVEFGEKQKRNIPSRSGLYSFLLQPAVARHPHCSYLMYVGQAKNLQVRFGQYWNREQTATGRPKIRRFLYQYTGYVWFCYCEAPVKRLDEFEDALLEAFVPPLNSKFPASISAAIGAF